MSTSPAEILDSLSAVSVHLVEHPILFVSLSYLPPPRNRYYSVLCTFLSIKMLSLLNLLSFKFLLCLNQEKYVSGLCVFSGLCSEARGNTLFSFPGPNSISFYSLIISPFSSLHIS